MSFHIYFDESNKIDQPRKKFSYYGAYGGEKDTITRTSEKLKEIFRLINTKSELHFVDYNHDQYLRKYFHALNEVINDPINFNIIIVDNTDAHNAATNMSISLPELRNLFYVKIPERLFYGMTRNSLKGEVQIEVDQNDEYIGLNLYSKIKEQMNAHAGYRNKKYKIHKVKGTDSKDSLPLQIIDTVLGIVMFLMEKNYLEGSNSSKIKSDLIYRFLIQEENINKFQNQIKLFRWSATEKDEHREKERLLQVPISEYLTEFLVFKTKHDLQEMVKLKNILSVNPDLRLKEIKKAMEYSNTMGNILIGYLNELDGLDRNNALFEKLKE
ncbi:hypothetical protein SAMN04489762_3471 [Terribacillus saccharophilus]|uniref:DUF3800 domain-containing protein n=2 Tax=Terribacillus saccharophilus TaxID=361277 RepID=A0AAX2EJV7_9BACI|nr:hypothetical protein SAMN04489762_3471 [Terribacillus saccharophilus]